jgi:diguanylate cyclase (GGDEF)-like protein/PAS domain S-box-containing protein
MGEDARRPVPVSMTERPALLHRLATPPGVVLLVAAWRACVVAVPEGVPTSVLSNVGALLAALAAAGACAGAARRTRGRVRAVWSLLGASAGSWGIGQTIWTVYEDLLGREVPFPSFADLGFLGAVPCVVAALWLVVDDGDPATRWRTLLDGLLVGASLLVLSWFVVLEGVVAEEAGQGLVTVIALAYPVTNVVVLAMIASLFLGRQRSAVAAALPLGLIASGVGGLAVADAGFAYLTGLDAYATGHWIDIGWVAGYLLLLAASRRDGAGDRAPSVTASSQRAALLPYTAVALAVTAGLVDFTLNGNLDAFVIYAAGGLFALLIVRQVLALHENESLTATLRARMEELRHGEERFRALVQHSSDVVALVDRDGVVGWLSDSVTRVLDLRRDTLLGGPLERMLDVVSSALLRDTIADLDGEAFGIRTLELRTAAGRPIEATITNLLDVPSVQGLVCNIRDVTEERALQEQLAHQAFHDSLTALANRALFADRVDHALRRRRGGLAVLFLDLDGFKFINDWLGHAAGDELLTQVAARLRDCMRPGDTIARLGGDEFAILVEDADARDAVAVAERVAQALEPPFLIADRVVDVTGSIGIATSTDGVTACEELLRNADLAMYRAKAVGGGGHELFDEAMHAALVEQLQLESDLGGAVAGGQLVLHYQPTYELGDGHLTGVEALVRWQHPTRGLLGPVAFIPDAERTGAITAIGEWVLETACQQAAAWTRDLPETATFTMSVNVSGVQVTPALPGIVAGVLERTGLPASRLVLEMTESTLIGAADSAAVLADLKAVGVGLAIDDFGTGYSSLSYLHQYPVDRLKIDRSFVARIHDAEGSREMVAAILQLAASLALDTVAEGVESADDLEALRGLGCAFAQGYHLARPAPAEEIAGLLAVAPAAGPALRAPEASGA